MKQMRTFLLLLLLILSSASTIAAQTTPCEGENYTRALCLYRTRHYSDAERLFATIVAAQAEDPVTLKAKYFLIRSQMKLRKWKEASNQLREIYSLSPLFYREWSCDFLLGECRRHLGKE